MKRPVPRYAHYEGHTDLAFTEDGQSIITCGRDGDIRIFNGIEDDDPTSVGVGEWALSVLHMSDTIYVTTDDNIVLKYQHPSLERNGIIRRFTAPCNHLSSTKNCKMLAVGCEDMSVVIFSMPDKELCKFEDAKGPILSVALSPKGDLVAASSGDGFLRIWEVAEKRLVKEFNVVPKVNTFVLSDALCRMKFEPNNGNQLAYPKDMEIEIINTKQWSVNAHLGCQSVSSPFSIVDYSACGQYLAASSVKGDVCIWDVSKGTLLNHLPSEDGKNIRALKWNPNGNGELGFTDSSGALSLISNCYSPEDSTHPVANSGPSLFDDDPIVDSDDDGNTISLEKLKKECMPDEDSRDSVHSGTSEHSRRREIVEIPHQSPFQPSSTPLHLEARYMVWNDVGIVRCFNTQPEPAIEVQFHDVNLHHSIFMTNNQNNTMASLSTSAFAMAGETPSKLTVMPLKSSTKLWVSQLVESEEILAMAASSDLVAIATDSYFVRVYNIYGTQRAVLSLPGQPVAMAAKGLFVLVAYHASGPTSKSQNIALHLYSFFGSGITSKDFRLALSPSTNLAWLGFTDRNTPCAYDSGGLVRLYSQADVWIPVCNTRTHVKSMMDSFFVTEVQESEQVVRGVWCKGCMYPLATPAPTVCELPMQVPMCEMATQKSLLEETLFRCAQTNAGDREKMFKESALKLFALACKSELDNRALEIVEMLSDPQVVVLATKYASKFGTANLQRRLEGLMETNENSAEKTPVPAKPIIKRKPISSKQFAAITQPDSQSNSNSESTLTNNQSLNVSSDSVTVPSWGTPNRSDAAVTNPFIKSKNVSTTNPLSLTDKYAGFKNVEPTKKDKDTDDFQTWFEEEKKNLRFKSPDLSEKEIVRECMSKWKSMIALKRKREPENTDCSPKQPKLSSFAFTKNSSQNVN